MELTPGSAEALHSLNQTSRVDLAEDMQRLAERVQELVPSCVGVSITIARGALTFTLVASSEVAAQLDATQYSTGGPCLDAAHGGEEQRFVDVLSEDRWQTYAQAAAAAHVRSSLALPLTTQDQLDGSLNIYAADPDAFSGTNDELRELAGAPAGALVTNADLGFTTRQRSDDAPRALKEGDLVNQAVGVLIAAHRIDAESAEARLQEMALRGGVSVPEAARTVLDDKHGR